MYGLAVLCFLLLESGVCGFGILRGESLTHQVITERAILNITVQVCRSLALSEGRDFSFPPQPFAASSVAAACGASKSSKSFIKTIQHIKTKNWQTDILYALSAHRHCDNEKLIEGKKLITDGLSVIKASNNQQNFVSATSSLGRILHTLQDFYSHSNWVEIGSKFPNSNLIRGNAHVGNIAAKTRATCRSCSGDDCRNNILKDILDNKILTSGYFSQNPFSKPSG
ncbi:hypothetical protein AMECASPLE_034958 [Ameca splendens]|uniref:VWA7 N-terminal domain-containing protein n=1 Tax=Ameca splendens TaxID=208324 RepID=A0ABV0YIB5_9TELE